MGVVSCGVLHGRIFGLYRTVHHPVMFYSPAGTALATASYSSNASLTVCTRCCVTPSLGKVMSGLRELGSEMLLNLGI